MPSSFPIDSSIATGGLSYISCGPSHTSFSVVFVHGWACQSTDYNSIFHELSHRDLEFRVIAPDLPGHGRSPTSACPDATLANFASALITFIDDLGLRDVVLVGHSMGFRVVLKAWDQARHAGRPNIKGLAFLDGSHYGFRPSLFSFDTGDARSREMTAGEVVNGKLEVFRRMFSANTPTAFQTSAQAHVKAMDHEYSDALRGSYIAYDRTTLDSHLASFGLTATPLLNLQSTDIDAENQRVPLKAGETSRWMSLIDRNVPHSTQVVVENSGHFPHVDQPRFVAEKLISFVRNLETKS